MTADPNCESCLGTGIVTFTYFDTEITRQCHCIKSEPDDYGN